MPRGGPKERKAGVGRPAARRLAEEAAAKLSSAEWRAELEEALEALGPSRAPMERALRLASIGAEQVREELRPLGEFEASALLCAMRIPRGRVATYASIAEALGRPKAARAVGRAMARNPLPILIPCHRVVRYDLSLGGYSLGEAAKRALLEAEGVRIRGRRAEPEFVWRPPKVEGIGEAEGRRIRGEVPAAPSGPHPRNPIRPKPSRRIGDNHRERPI